MASQTENKPQSVYDFTLKDAKGNDVDLSIYKGKVLLIVNVASKCGLTDSNYKDLNHLYEKYRSRHASNYHFTLAARFTTYISLFLDKFCMFVDSNFTVPCDGRS